VLLINTLKSVLVELEHGERFSWWMDEYGCMTLVMMAATGTDAENYDAS